MARPPYSPIPDATATTQGTSYENVNPNPAEFGGLVGAATQRLGGTEEQGGAELGQSAVMLQQRQNQIVASDAFNQFQSKILNLTAGDPNDPNQKGYFALQGKMAMDAYPAASKSIDDAREQISAGMNDAQRLVFEESSRRLQTYTMDSMRSHFIQQQNVYGATVNQATQQNAERAIGAHPSDDQTFYNNVMQMRSGAVRELQNKGMDGDPKVVMATIEAANQRAIVARVQAIQAADPVNGSAAAAQWLENGTIPDTPVPGKAQTFSPVKDHLEPNTYDTLARSVRAGAERAQVAGVAAGVISGTPAPAQAQGAAINSTWQRLKSYEHGEDAQGNALVSPAGATGLTQMEPATAQETAQKHGVPYHPEMLTPGAAYDSSYADMMGRLHFGDLVEKYQNVTLATAAYNAGSGRVDGWLSTIGDPRKGTMSEADWASHIPINETRKYTQTVAQPGTGLHVPVPQMGATLATATGGPVVAGPGLAPGGVQPAIAQPGAPQQQQQQSGAQPAAGSPQHAPESYGIEADMVQRAWTAAQNAFPNRPDLQMEAVRPVYEHIQQMNVLQQKYESEQAKAQRDAQDKILNNAITVLNADPTKFDPAVLNAKDAAGNYVLTPQQRDSLDAVVKRKYAEAGIEDTAPYGPGYAKLYSAIIAPPTDPNRITSVTDIIRHGAPGGDLTGLGVEKLARVLGVMDKPDAAATARTAGGFLTDAKSRLSFEEDTGPVKIRDPVGEHIFNTQFLPWFDKGLAAAEATGKPEEIDKFLSRANIDKQIAILRPPAQMARDRLSATGQLPNLPPEAPGTPIPPAPKDANEGEWSSLMTAPPKAGSGQPYSHAAWAKAINLLLQNPTAQTIRQFDDVLGSQGYSGAEILQRLKAPEHEFGLPVGGGG